MTEKRKVLLIEPNYKNKYPPIGLMKISTYYKQRGWHVTFYKGDLRDFVIGRTVDKCIAEFEWVDETIDWNLKYDYFRAYIKQGKSSDKEAIEIEHSRMSIFLYPVLDRWKNYYKKNEWEKHPEFDRVGITTLFTFYWDITIETIQFAKKLAKNCTNNIDFMIGGVLATIQPDEIEEAVGIRPWVGVLGPGSLDEGDTTDIDSLPLDYSILDEVDYQYPMSNAYYGYMTRGCIRHCPFCAVPKLEPNYKAYIPLIDRVNGIKEEYGDQQNLLLMDNNVLASKCLPDIIKDIIDCGFARGSKYEQPNLLAISIRNLKEGKNDRAYIRKCQRLISEFHSKLQEHHKEDSYAVYKAIQDNHIDKISTSRKENILLAYEAIKDIHKKHWHPSYKQRYVDFNQGVDARLFNETNVSLLAQIAIRPLRIAFDDIKTRKPYEKAVRLSVSAGLKDFSNYLLYNFEDQPVDLYTRLRINVDLCEELNVSIYSFPMKYHPLTGENSHDRDFIGKHWNRKYIRAIQAILNSTKGKVGRGKTFFYEAFGKNELEYQELLEMPEAFIIYRFFFKWLDTKGLEGTEAWRKTWRECSNSLEEEEFDKIKDIIHKNEFSLSEISSISSEMGLHLLSFYTDYPNKDIGKRGSRLYELKKEYDANPTIELKRKKS